MRGGGVFKAAVAFAVVIVVGCLGLAPSLAGSRRSRWFWMWVGRLWLGR